MASPVYDSLNKAWKSTCRVLFGTEAGELENCAEWLEEYKDEILRAKSAFSGQDVSFAQNDYDRSSKFAAFDEIDYGKRFRPLGINDMKDIDSLTGAIAERLMYTGNVVLGKSSMVEGSSNVQDSHFVLESTVVADSKYVGYCQHVSKGEYAFGLLGSDRGTHAVKCMGSDLKRCFECHMVNYLSDCYYCAKAQNCHDCMFCFGMENGSYAIGNTPLPKEKYSAIKAKLISEIAGKLKKDRRVFSLLGMLEKCSSIKPDPRLKFKKEAEQQFNITPIDRAFASASNLLFGRSIGPVLEFENYLLRHVPRNVITHSPLSKSAVVAGGYRTHLLEKFDIAKRIATEDEMRSIGVMAGLADVDGLALSLETLCSKLHPVAYTNLDKVAGKCGNFRNCPVIIDSFDCMEGSAFLYSKKCAYDFWPMNSEAVFGSCATFNSSFCMNSYYSKNMARSFECDGCESCADAYFLHNCENVRDSMFCFNAKNLNNAIGNAPLPPEQYKKVKAAIVAQMADELERTKNLKWDIFNIGAAKHR